MTVRKGETPKLGILTTPSLDAQYRGFPWEPEAKPREISLRHSTWSPEHLCSPFKGPLSQLKNRVCLLLFGNSALTGMREMQARSSAEGN